jgi:hypothetical protein
MSTSVFCIAPTKTVADSIVSRLKSEDFSDNDISVLFPDKSTTRDFAHEKNTKAPEGAVTGAGAGGLVGGTLGLLAGIGLLAIPGLGPFIAAGPIMASLSGIAAGAALGGITGALIGMGIPEIVAKRYEGKLKDGNILIAVHAEDSERVDRAKEIFENANAEDITTGSTSSAPKAKRKDHDSTLQDTHNDRDDAHRTITPEVGGRNRDNSAADSKIEITRTGRDPIKRERTPLK